MGWDNGDGMVWYGMVWYGMVWYGIGWDGIGWSQMVWDWHDWLGDKSLQAKEEFKLLASI